MENYQSYQDEVLDEEELIAKAIAESIKTFQTEEIKNEEKEETTKDEVIIDDLLILKCKKCLIL
jgi:hypothetical protein